MILMKTPLTKFKLQTKCVGNKQEKTTDANQYVILLRRIILGKATSQDYKLESQDRDDTFKKSTISNFLSDLLAYTNDEFINQRLKLYRSKMIETNKVKSYPHVFDRLNKDAAKRQAFSSRRSS